MMELRIDEERNTFVAILVRIQLLEKHKQLPSNRVASECHKLQCKLRVRKYMIVMRYNPVPVKC